MSYKYYSLKRIHKTKATYYMIIGERSSGKTYAVLEEIIKNFCETGKQGAIIRRYEEDFRQKRAASMFAGLDSNGVIAKYSGGKYNHIVYRNGAWYPAMGEKVFEKPIAYRFSLASMEHDKSTSYPDINIILLDEFATRTGYLRDEFVLFMNVISTIVRLRDDVRIYMCANPVNQYCPYFAEMGITRIKDMKAGDLDVYTYGESDLSVAVEFVGGNKTKKPSDRYFAFDNPRLKMITHGAWEIPTYPHAPESIKPKDIKHVILVLFDGETIQGDLVKNNNRMYLFFHRKTTDIKDIEKDTIYADTVSPLRNWSNNILRPRNKIEEIITNLIVTEKVFYQDNMVGEIVNNYLKYCKKS